MEKNNVWSSMGKSLHEKISILEYLKLPSVVLCCFYKSLMISQKDSLPMLSCLQMILLCFLLYMTLKHLQMISIKI